MALALATQEYLIARFIRLEKAKDVEAGLIFLINDIILHLGPDSPSFLGIVREATREFLICLSPCGGGARYVDSARI